jgi:hypothetical protein
MGLGKSAPTKSAAGDITLDVYFVIGIACLVSHLLMTLFLSGGSPGVGPRFVRFCLEIIS